MAIEALKGKPWYVGLGAGLAVAAVLLLLGEWQVFSKAKDRIAQQEKELAKLEAKIQEGRAARARLPQFREEVRRLELELDKLLRILPARLNTEDLLRRLRALAEQGDLNLLVIRPGGLNNRDFYREWPIAISLEGTYHNLALFFDRIGRFSRIINIENLRVGGIDPGKNDGHTLKADFTAKTFVYRDVELETEEQAAAAGGGG